MGMLLYVPNGIYSPYSCLLDSELWIEIYDHFIRDACQLLGVCVNSPLTTCVNAGCIAIPALLNIKQVMIQRQVTGIWNGKDELPVSLYFFFLNKFSNKKQENFHYWEIHLYFG